ncbi:glutamate--cysteine ligase [candidate division KSB1 bacterium]|nr:glutamate--cysteine ligase [candidate division KSB1 bacterium]NIR72840.1 glutamate--cysteine ligase [candidate division KSB1 bacterium]NIS26880.1 glutamate--cysteine ligase [candidate division KSB1 bacterium]NIT73676.1 glutamate--cysteine ligase [candidate division KSB1 bacterium]NIU27547.1 glutamate--cysteine ligase [candidate division KSB1 bacterium]
MKITFNGSPNPTLGVEVELQVLDPETKNLVSGAQEILAKTDGDHHVKPELIQSTIELNTDVCSNIMAVRTDLTERLNHLIEICDELGYELACVGTHPFSKWEEQDITPQERYHMLVDRCQWPARRLMIFGLHVHVGVPSGEKAIAIFNSLTTFLPHLLALSASSPFFDDADTGLASTRVKIFETLPTAGLPYRLLNWAEFQRFMITLVNAKAIESIREVWWDLRPHPGFGTVELRICDGLPTLDEIVALTAFIQALVVWLGEEYDEGMYLPVHRHWIVRENKWRAARWSTDADIIIDEDGNLQPLAEGIEELLETLSPIAKRLGSHDELMRVRDIVKNGPSYKRQRKVYEETGDFKKVVENLVNELRNNVTTSA